MYIKIASVIEILIGLAMGGLGGFMFWLSSQPPNEPAQMMGGFLGMLMILLSILLIIFGCLRTWLPSIVTLVIATALFTIVGLGYPICFLGSVGTIICLILFILGKISPAPPNRVQELRSSSWFEVLLMREDRGHKSIFPEDLLKSAKSAVNKHPKIVILLIVILPLLRLILIV